MRRPPSAVLGLLLCAACTGQGAVETSPPAAAPAAPDTGRSTGTATLLALGDSVAFGIGAPSPGRDGYVPLLADRLPGPDVEVRNLALPGATTSSMLRAQVPRAVALLEERDVRLVTVTIGGNDAFVPVLQACSDDPAGGGCRTALRTSLASVASGLDEGLGVLDDAVPPGTPIAVMAYYDPVPTCRLSALAPLSAQVLEGAGEQAGLNDVLRDQAAAHGALVVETADRVSGGGLVGGEDCLHPSGSGHAEIADAFVEAVRDHL